MASQDGSEKQGQDQDRDRKDMASDATDRIAEAEEVDTTKAMTTPKETADYHTAEEVAGADHQVDTIMGMDNTSAGITATSESDMQMADQTTTVVTSEAERGEGDHDHLLQHAENPTQRQQ